MQNGIGLIINLSLFAVLHKFVTPHVMHYRGLRCALAWLFIIYRADRTPTSIIYAVLFELLFADRFERWVFGYSMSDEPALTDMIDSTASASGDS
jgi:hypothetical protein